MATCIGLNFSSVRDFELDISPTCSVFGLNHGGIFLPVTISQGSSI
jgi:hypothetical protein